MNAEQTVERTYINHDGERIFAMLQGSAVMWTSNPASGKWVEDDIDSFLLTLRKGGFRSEHRRPD